jgi:transcriptional regulator with XRE-family HTH domain
VEAVMGHQATLASFLRARRDLVRPDDVGLQNYGRRRVSGLRRAEVAQLAGISVEYYLRLETGRDAQPSDQVLRGLANALQLSDDATEYMHNLVNRSASCLRLNVQLDPHLEGLIDAWPTPAYVQSPDMTIQLSNVAAQTLSPFFASGVNLLKATFLDAQLRQALRNWDSLTDVLVKQLRFMTSAARRDDRPLAKLIDEVSGSKRFCALWERHEVQRKTTGQAFFSHPDLGPVDFVYRTLVIPESQHTIVSYFASSCQEGRDTLPALASAGLIPTTGSASGSVTRGADQVLPGPAYP